MSRIKYRDAEAMVDKGKKTHFESLNEEEGN